MIFDLHMEGIADFLKGETKPLPSQFKGVKADPAGELDLQERLAVIAERCDLRGDLVAEAHKGGFGIGSTVEINGGHQHWAGTGRSKLVGKDPILNGNEVISLVVFLLAEVDAFGGAGVESIGAAFGGGDDVGLMAVAQGHVVEGISQGMRFLRLHVADFHRRIGPDTYMEEENIVLGGNRLADARHVCTGLGADVAEAVDIDPVDLDIAPHPLLIIEGIEAVAAGFGAGRAKEMDVSHLRQCLHPGDAIAAMDPVVVTFHCDAGDAGVFQWLQGLDGAGEGAGEDLTGVEQVAGDEDKIDPLRDGGGHNAAEHAEEVIVAFGLTDGGAVGFAEVDVSGVEEFNVQSTISLSIYALCI